MSREPPRARSLAASVVLYGGLVASVVLVGLLARQIAREREKTTRTEVSERGALATLQTVRGQLREAKAEQARLEEDRVQRARVVEGEQTALRHDLADARKERDGFRDGYRAAVAERDRATQELLTSRRELLDLRTDLANAGARAEVAAAAAKARAAEAETASRRLAEATAHVEALLRPLLQDLRSPDGSIRVRAHEALCAFAGESLPYRPNGTAEEREADAIAIEAAVLGKAPK